MTLEKIKRKNYASSHWKMSRREARKTIRLERKIERVGIKAGFITKKTRFICNHCKVAFKHSEWLKEMGGIIRCPKCLEDIMGFSFIFRIEDDAK